MKEGWEIKKLGEVCETSSGGTPSKTHKEYYEDGKIPWLRSGEISQGLIYDSELYITEEGVRNSSAKLFPVNTVLIAMYGATVGQVGILKKEMATNQAVCGIMPNPLLNPMFLMLYLKSQRNNFLGLAAGGAQPNISQTIIKNYPIPIPPLPTQERIVSELDCINSIIEKKREQLKELDALAQSIFYDMFGDPIQNEKGWEVRKLGEVGELARGVSKHRPRNAPELLGGATPLIQTGDVSNSGMYIHKYNSTYSELGLSQSRLWPSGTLCIPIAATIGKCSILTFDACFPDSVVGFIVDERYTCNEYIYYIFGDLQKILEDNAPAVAQKNINLQVLNNLSIPLPPLSLQQSFASKIEAIEKQKELIKRSIAETETLLASRMQYYFG